MGIKSSTEDVTIKKKKKECFHVSTWLGISEQIVLNSELDDKP